jgi:hypothetical protein
MALEARLETVGLLRLEILLPCTAVGSVRNLREKLSGLWRGKETT